MYDLIRSQYLCTFAYHLDGGHHADGERLVSLVRNGPLLRVDSALQLVEVGERKLDRALGLLRPRARADMIGGGRRHLFIVSVPV